MVLLAGLSALPWAKLMHAYGPATDVPDLLRALADPESAPAAMVNAAAREERSIFEHVTWKLWGNVFHQGSVWQVSAYVVPFLYEILKDGRDDAELRRFLIQYLHALAVGYPEDIFPTKIDPDTFFTAKEREAEEDEQNDEHGDDEGGASDGADTTSCEQRCFVAVEGGLDEIRRLVSAPDEETALLAIATLASFQRSAARSCEALRRVLVEESSGARPMRLGATLVALAQLGDATAQEEAEKRVGDPDLLVAIHAAAASVLAKPAGVSNAAVGVLTAPLGEMTEHATPFTDTIGTLVGRSLARLPPHLAEQAARAIGANLATTSLRTNLAMTESLLRLVFGDEHAPGEASKLTAAQRRALEAIRDHGAFKSGESFYGNYSLLLGGWGLPNEVEMLAPWLAGSPVVGRKN